MSPINPIYRRQLRLDPEVQHRGAEKLVNPDYRHTCTRCGKKRKSPGTEIRGLVGLAIRQAYIENA